MLNENDKIDKEELRKKQAINEESEYEINKLKTECFSYHENLEIINEVNNNLMKEITLKKEICEKFQLQFDSIANDTSVKIKEINRHLNDFVSKNIPYQNLKDVSESQKDNDFQNLLFNFIQIKYMKYNYEDKSTIEAEDEQKFRISQKSTFSELKLNACNYWSIENFDDYYFTDESEALIYDEKLKVNEYFMNYSTRDRKLKLLTNRVIKDRNQIIFSQAEIMREKNKFNKDKSKKMNEVADEGMIEEKIRHEIRSFNKEFPSLKQYMMTDEDQARKKQMKNLITSTNKYQAKNIETSFFMLIVLVLFYVFNLYFIFGTRDIGLDSSNIEYINQIFSTKNVTNLNSLQSYINDVIGKIYPSYKSTYQFKLDETGNLSDEMEQIQSNLNFIFTSQIKIVVSRVKKYPTCSQYKAQSVIEGSKNCYYAFYDESSVYKEYKLENKELKTSLGLIKDLNFTLPEQSGVSFQYKGLTGDYNGEGYVITLNYSMKHADFLIFTNYSVPSEDLMNIAIDDNSNSRTFLVDLTTRAWIFTFTLFFPGTNKFMHPIEFLPTGRVYAGSIEARIFSPDIYEQANSVLVTDVFRILCLIILFFFFVIDVKDRLLIFPQNPIEWVSFKQMFSIYIFIVYSTSFLMKMVHCYHNPKDYYNPLSDTNIDTYKIAFYYNEIFFLESILFEGVSIKLLDFLILNDNFKLFSTCIHVGLKTFFKYILIIILTYTCFGVVSHLLFGPYIEDYESIISSFRSILLISTGYFDLRNMMMYHSGWGTFYFLAFFILILLFLNVIFISLFAESVKITVVQQGYPDDYENNNWQFKDYIIWLCHFVDDDEEIK